MVYLWFRFGNWTFGLAAVICWSRSVLHAGRHCRPVHFLHGTFIATCWVAEDFKIDLPAVAALLTLSRLLGQRYIVVFDRIREVRGKNPD